MPMRVSKPIIMVVVCALFVSLVLLGLCNGLAARVSRVVTRMLPVKVIPETRTSEEDLQHILSMLPPVDAQELKCRFSLGPWESAPGLRLSHQEGAVVLSPDGFAMLSGFSHYVEQLLIATSRVDVMNGSTLQWQVVDEPAPTIASHIQGASIGEYGWIAGGFLGQHPGKASASVWRYSLIDHTWEAGPSLPGARASGALVAMGETLHYIGGLDKDRQSDLTEHLTLKTSAPSEWQVQAQLERPRNHFQAVALGEVLYAVGGQKGHDKSVRDLPFLDAYSVTKNRWIPLQDMPNARSHAEMSTFLHEGHIFVAGGRTAGNGDAPMQSIVEYSPYENRWREVGNLPVPLISPLARIIDGKFYVAGGGLTWNQPQLQAWTAPLLKECH